MSRLAYAWEPGETVLLRNLRKLVETVTEEQLEVSHRRLFVKIWIRLLDELRLGGERDLGGDEVKALVRDEQVHLLEEDLSQVPTFFGQPVPSASMSAADDDGGGGKARGKKRRSARE